MPDVNLTSQERITNNYNYLLNYTSDLQSVSEGCKAIDLKIQLACGDELNFYGGFLGIPRGPRGVIIDVDYREILINELMKKVVETEKSEQLPLKERIKCHIKGPYLELKKINNWCKGERYIVKTLFSKYVVYLDHKGKVDGIKKITKHGQIDVELKTK